MANDKTEKFYLLGIGKEMKIRFNAVYPRSKRLRAFISIPNVPNVPNFQDFSHNIWGSFIFASVIFLLAHLSRSWFVTVDPPGKINNFGSTTVISSGRSLFVFLQCKYQPLSENKRAFLVPASTGCSMVVRLWSQPITAQKCVVVFDGSLALQVIDTCSGLETIVIAKLLVESFNEKRNNGDACYKCC